MQRSRHVVVLWLAIAVLGSACARRPDPGSLDWQLEARLLAAANGGGLAAFRMPASDALAAIPQDPSNPLTAAKVELGKFLFHETGLATAGVNPGARGTWSCASCHQVAAGFKAGIRQGIGEGGSGFGTDGQLRMMTAGFAADAADPALRPDVQPLASPTILNVAYQDVMLWNGHFGNAVGGRVNAGIDAALLMTPGTPKVANGRRYSGVETQVLAGMKVHRLALDGDSLTAADSPYRALFDAAYPAGSRDPAEDGAKAIAAWERTVLANRAPFQRWLRGEHTAMNDLEKQGALLFFGSAGCSGCHRGPALSSEVGASAEQLFFAVGFADFDIRDGRIQGRVDEATARGRGGFTRVAADDYKFKVPTLYNLADASVFGHGGSFRSVREVVAYKNAAVPQKPLPPGRLDPRFVPLGLDDAELEALTAFLESGLRDPQLDRYVPSALPTGNCFPVADPDARADLGC